MREVCWRDCIENNSAIKISPDKARARSLIETADARTRLFVEINEKNCNFVFEDHYTSLLEMIQALVILRGYKVLNHLCLGYYLRDVLKREELFVVFDDLRYKRNSLTYYGRRMDFETAKVSIQRCKDLAKEIKRQLDEGT